MTNKELQEFNVGDRVEHELWGVGTVVMIGDNNSYTVHYDCDLKPIPRKASHAMLKKFTEA